jgi:N-acetylmuramoyl-L-alanine amidase
MRICIDPGHHVSVKGKRSPQVPPGIIEWEFDMSVSMCLESLLIDAGHEAFRTMQISEPTNKPPVTRRSIGAKADLFISVHANAAEDSAWSHANGFCVFHKAAGAQLARLIAASYKAAIPEIRPRFGGSMHRGYDVLPWSIPSVLIECGFMTNKTEAAFMAEPKNQQRIARAIAEGVLAFIERNQS